MRLCDKILKLRALYYFRNQSLSNIYNTNFDSLSFHFIGAFDCLPVAKVHSRYPLSSMQKHAWDIQLTSQSCVTRTCKVKHRSILPGGTCRFLTRLKSLPEIFSTQGVKIQRYKYFQWSPCIIRANKMSEYVEHIIN